MDMKYLQEVQEELLSSIKIGGGMTTTSCGTQELNDMIKSMAQRIQHGSKNRKEEMKIHDKLKELKITKEKMYTAPEPPIKYSYGKGYIWQGPYWGEERARARKQSLRREFKNYLFDVEVLHGDQIKVMRLETKLRLVKQHISSLQTYDLKEVNSERRITYNLIQMLRHLKETCYDAYQSLSPGKRYLAEDIPKVKQLCGIEVEGFMAKRNENEAFGDNVY
uniref:uncharacterized protein LOC122608575 isoform X2 n=1 Tax=Erigeron canadensis TaxID=72917 RepID=UPI001CB9AE4A|nr:uncharacterized protein LOC122608575 isoform X2 [Erigeron canadensis]